MKKFVFLIAAQFLFASTKYITYKQTLYLSGGSLDVIQTEGIKYLNDLRQKAGMIPLVLNDALNIAAVNHSNYCVINNYAGHEEYEGYEGFTGEWPSDRAVYAGYKSTQVLENLSTNNKDVNDSIDNLFSAVYHRLGFLNESIDEIGIGYASGGTIGNVYTYDMGNGYINNLCSQSSFDINGAYYYNVCADETLKIPVEIWDGNTSINMSQNPDIILWPYKDANDVPPVFYEESPDPLPDYGVSGYPVSVKFNQYYFKKPPLLQEFKLYDDQMNEITDTRLLTSQTDPNNHLSDYEFVLFPLKRLEWGKTYNVKASFLNQDSNESIVLDWSFKTRSLPYPYYKITEDYTVLNVLANKKYALYFVPQGPDDKITGWGASYSCEFNSSFIDLNTIDIELSGDIGGFVELSLNNGKKVKLIISNEENSSLITQNENVESEQNAQVDPLNTYIQTLNDGWHIVASSENVDFKNITSEYQIIWTYKNSKWCGYSNNEAVKNVLVQKNIYCEGTEPNQAFWILK